MADETNPKKETVRITLPPRMNESPSAKKETVRIEQPPSSDKGQTIRIQPPVTPLGGQPKKETTKIAGAGSPLPPPPKLSGIPAMPPKPPGSFSLPTQKPSITPPTPPTPPAAPAPKAPAAAAVPAPKPNAPKKETSRIVVPPPTTRMQMPKATVKLQQTQPLPQGPSAAVTTSTSLNTAAPVMVNAADPLVLWASVAVLVVSAGAAIISFLTLQACG